MEQQERKVALGYHSPTEWVFIPHVVAMYDTFMINVDVFNDAVGKAATSPSDYENRKAEILQVLLSEGRLKPVKYEVTEDAHTQLDHLLDFFLRHHPDELRQLAAGAFRSFREHELGTVSQLMHPEDPRARDILSKVPEWERAEKEILAGAPFDDLPYLRPTIKSYFEDCLFTPMQFSSEYNPIFSWEGYAPFEQWLIRRRADYTDASKRLRRGSEALVIQALCECAMPFEPIRSVSEMAKLLKLWDAFEGVRTLATSQNEAIWKELDTARAAVASDRIGEFMKDFERYLDVRVKLLSREITDVSNEIEKVQSTATYKLVRFFVATIDSLVEGFGGVSDLLMQLYDGLIKRQVVEVRPTAASLIEYERTMKHKVLERLPFTPVCRTDVVYAPQVYWDDEQMECSGSIPQSIKQ